MVLGERQENPAGNSQGLAALEAQKWRESMAEYSAQADGNDHQFGKSEVKVSDEDERESLPDIKNNGNNAGLDIAGPEDIDCAGIAITVFTDIFIQQPPPHQEGERAAPQ